MDKTLVINWKHENKIKYEKIARNHSFLSTWHSCQMNLIDVSSEYPAANISSIFIPNRTSKCRHIMLTDWDFQHLHILIACNHNSLFVTFWEPIRAIITNYRHSSLKCSQHTLASIHIKITGGEKYDLQRNPRGIAQCNGINEPLEA